MGLPSLAPGPVHSHLINKAPEKKQARELKHQVLQTTSAGAEGRAQLGCTEPHGPELNYQTLLQAGSSQASAHTQCRLGGRLTLGM